ncbi:MAG: YraN family protein [Gammaproteobacteria bacterium]
MMSSHTSDGDTARAIGARLEKTAEQYLNARGLVTLSRNHRCRGGEIDLVMRSGECIVFVEVRYRRSRAFGSAAESVDRRKQQRVLLAARHYLARHRLHDRQPCRFDVLAMHGPHEALEVDWIEGAFSA